MEENEMNGWTGLNPSLARRNIERFYDSCVEVLNNFSASVNELFSELKGTWASPNAVKFSLKYGSEIEDALTDFSNEAFSRARSAANAYNSVAYAHGANSVGCVDKVGTPFVDFNLEDNKDGVVGMNIELVENDIIPNFEKKINNVINLINEIPTSLALYDDNNGQRHYFSCNISSFKNRFENILSDLKISIKEYSNTKLNEIKFAKQSAIDALNN